MANNIDKVRILLLGDSGVGKTCLARLIAHHESLFQPDWTVGCNIEVKLHLYNKGTSQEKLYFIELFDIGGSLSHKMARSVFYTPHDGIILVHDLTNRKSHENLREWIYEVLDKEGKDTIKSIISSTPSNISPPGSVGGSSYLSNRRKNPQIYNNIQSSTNLHRNQIGVPHRNVDDLNEGNDFDPEEFIGLTQVPILVVGTKVDLLDGGQCTEIPERIGGIAEQCGAEEIYLNCHKADSLSSERISTEKLLRFFNKVIDKKNSVKDTSHFYGRSGQITERRVRLQHSTASGQNENNHMSNTNWRTSRPIESLDEMDDNENSVSVNLGDDNTTGQD